MPRRGENIYKRKDGRWEGRYVKSHDTTGKIKYGYLYASTYSAMKEKMNNIKQTSVLNEKNKQEFYFKDISEKWLFSINQTVKESTYSKYKNTVYNHILPFFDRFTINEIDNTLLKQYTFNLLNNGNLRTGKSLSQNTTIFIISIIKNIFKYAENEGAEINCNFDNINIKQKLNKINVFTVSEQKKLCKYLMNKTDSNKLGVLICLYTGIRLGELCALKWKDINLTEKKITINKTLQRIEDTSENAKNKTKIVITTPKSISSVRDIPIPEWIVDILKNFKGEDDAYVLTGTCDKFVEPRKMQYTFKNYLKELNIQDRKFHCLRHTFATMCVELDFEIKSLSEILGHSSVNITLNKYVHSSFDLKRNNMNKLILV